MYNKDMFNLFKKYKPVSRKTMFDHGIPLNIKFETEINKDWIIITSPDLPGFITQSKNIKKLPYQVSDAVLCYFDVPNEEGDLLPGAYKFGNFEFKSQGRKVQLA